MHTNLHELTPLERAREFHRQLLSHIPTYTGEELARLRELDPTSAGEPNRALRESHQIFGVPLLDTWHYPRFQFDAHGRPCAQAAQLLEALGVREDPWDMLRWLVEPHPALGDVPPVDLWETEPERVIALARQEH
jgi:hypothetical protein